MSISPRFMQDLRDRLTLSEIIGRRIKLARAGHEYKGCCPFHREKSPSFYVNDDKQFFHCFGCGAHGDVIGFAMRHDNLSFIEAVEALAPLAGMEVPQQTPHEKEVAQKDKGLYALCEDATKWFEKQLHDPRHREVLAYLHGRGLKQDVIDGFRIGYAPSDEQALTTYLNGLGYRPEQMVEAGLVKISTKGTAPYAFFRDRVIFPVADMRGRVVAFGGRILPDHLRPPSRGDFKPPKYINSSDTPLFHKGRMLYAGQHARLAAKDQPILVVEGYMDVIACHQAGFRGAVAPLGTALTDEQIAVLWKMIPHDVKEPILCFDGDEAGYRAALRASERAMPLLKANQSVRFAFLPSGDDPDTYIRDKGSEGFSHLINRAMPLVDFLWNHHVAGKTFQTPESRAGLSATLENIAAQIPERDLQYHYRQIFRDKLKTLFGQTWQPGAKKKSNDPVITLPPVGKKKVDTLPPLIMLATLINHPQIYPYIVNESARLNFNDENARDLHMAVIDILENSFMNDTLELDREQLLNQIEAKGFTTTTHDILGDKLVIAHAGFSRPEVSDEVALAGWKSVWNQWDRTLDTDLQAALKAWAENDSPENTERMQTLRQMRQANESPND